MVELIIGFICGILVRVLFDHYKGVKETKTIIHLQKRLSQQEGVIMRLYDQLHELEESELKQYDEIYK